MRLVGRGLGWTHTVHHFFIGFKGGLGVHSDRVVRRRGLVLWERKVLAVIF